MKILKHSPDSLRTLPKLQLIQIFAYLNTLEEYEAVTIDFIRLLSDDWRWLKRFLKNNESRCEIPYTMRVNVIMYLLIQCLQSDALLYTVENAFILSKDDENAITNKIKRMQEVVNHRSTFFRRLELLDRIIKRKCAYNMLRSMSNPMEYLEKAYQFQDDYPPVMLEDSNKYVPIYGLDRASYAMIKMIG